MSDTEKITNHEEAHLLAGTKMESSNMARCYSELCSYANAVNWYMDASEEQLVEAGDTRKRALERIREIEARLIGNKYVFSADVAGQGRFDS